MRELAGSQWCTHTTTSPSLLSTSFASSCSLSHDTSPSPCMGSYHRPHFNGKAGCCTVLRGKLFRCAEGMTTRAIDSGQRRRSQSLHIALVTPNPGADHNHSTAATVVDCCSSCYFKQTTSNALTHSLTAAATAAVAEMVPEATPKTWTTTRPSLIPKPRVDWLLPSLWLPKIPVPQLRSQTPGIDVLTTQQSRKPADIATWSVVTRKQSNLDSRALSPIRGGMWTHLKKCYF